jgi:hypothetical protein
MSEPDTTDISCETQYCIAHDSLVAGYARSGIYFSDIYNVIIDDCVCYNNTDYYFWLGAEAEMLGWWKGDARAK